MANYDKKPSIYEAVGNGSYLYRWNIREVEVERNAEDNENEATSQWECEEVVVWLPVTPNKITKAVITSKWDSNYEQKLINDYNAVLLGVYVGDDAKEKSKAYTDYLNERKVLKEQIDKDCKELGI